jgi:hypothetical protein
MKAFHFAQPQPPSDVTHSNICPLSSNAPDVLHVFSAHFCPYLCAPGKTFQSVTHPKIALGLTRLTMEFFIVELIEKKVYLGGMSILSILLSLKARCHSV